MKIQHVCQHVTSLDISNYLKWVLSKLIYELENEKTDKKVCVTSKNSDQTSYLHIPVRAMAGYSRHTGRHVSPLK